MKYALLAVIVMNLLFAVLYATKTLDLSVVSTVTNQLVIAGFAYIFYLDYKDR